MLSSACVDQRAQIYLKFPGFKVQQKSLTCALNFNVKLHILYVNVVSILFWRSNTHVESFVNQVVWKKKLSRCKINSLEWGVARQAVVLVYLY